MNSHIYSQNMNDSDSYHNFFNLLKPILKNHFPKLDDDTKIESLIKEIFNLEIFANHSKFKKTNVNDSRYPHSLEWSVNNKESGSEKITLDIALSFEHYSIDNSHKKTTKYYRCQIEINTHPTYRVKNEFFLSKTPESDAFLAKLDEIENLAKIKRTKLIAKHGSKIENLEEQNKVIKDDEKVLFHLFHLYPECLEYKAYDDIIQMIHQIKESFVNNKEIKHQETSNYLLKKLDEIEKFNNEKKQIKFKSSNLIKKIFLLIKDGLSKLTQKNKIKTKLINSTLVIQNHLKNSESIFINEATKSDEIADKKPETNLKDQDSSNVISPILNIPIENTSIDEKENAKTFKNKTIENVCDNQVDTNEITNSSQITKEESVKNLEVQNNSHNIFLVPGISIDHTVTDEKEAIAEEKPVNHLAASDNIIDKNISNNLSSSLEISEIQAANFNGDEIHEIKDLALPAEPGSATLPPSQSAAAINPASPRISRVNIFETAEHANSFSHNGNNAANSPNISRNNAALSNSGSITGPATKPGFFQPQSSSKNRAEKLLSQKRLKSPISEITPKSNTNGSKTTSKPKKSKSRIPEIMSELDLSKHDNSNLATRDIISPVKTNSFNLGSI